MALASTIVRYLRNNAIPYEVLDVPASASPAGAGTAAEIVARGVLMVDAVGPVLVVVPAARVLDTEGMYRLLGRRLTPATPEQISRCFHDCAPGNLPALGDAYGIRTLIDEALIIGAHSHVLTYGGDDGHLLRFSHQTFLNLQVRSLIAAGLTAAAAAAAPGAGTGAAATQASIAERLSRVDSLPAMPGLARAALMLRADPHAEVADLAALVESDPSLTAQVMRYANAPFFGYRGRVDSVHTAISRVLGYDMVMHLVLGLATARPFRIPADGPLGLRAFWRHAVYSAAMMQALSRGLPRAAALRAGTAYLAGLLHNFGLLLLGHLFPEHYRALCAAAAARPGRALPELEHEVLGCDHAWMGATLLQAWNLPPEVIIVAREHHHLEYTGAHAEAAALALVCDRALKLHGIGDGDDAVLPPNLLQHLHLDELKVLGAINRILEGCSSLDAMARQLAA